MQAEIINLKTWRELNTVKPAADTELVKCHCGSATYIMTQCEVRCEMCDTVVAVV